MQAKLLISFTLVISQISCIKLKYKVSPAYKETTELLSIVKLKHTRSFNQIMVIDEEHTESLTIGFFDTSRIHKGLILDIEKDKNLVYLKYDVLSVWGWRWGSTNSHRYSGTIEILNYKPNKVKIRENIIVSRSESSAVAKFIGTYTFKPNKN